jgi:hypothetical protein
MHPLLSFAIAAVLAAQAPCALADTMYKCVASNGKVAYSSLPCEGQAREARQFEVPAPESDEDSRARLKLESARLRVADQQFRRRQAASDAEYAHQARLAPRVRRTGTLRQQTQQIREEAERARAARDNAARIGNCTRRRLEAGCL